MQFEIEQKFSIDDTAGLFDRLSERGPEHLGVAHQHDTYYNHPARDFRATGEAFRIRRTDDGAFITYKGPKLDVAVKTRPEIELPLSDPAAWQQLLVTLGFQEVATVSKRRNRYRLSRPPFEVEIALDQVQHLGRFAEVEIIADESQADEARRVVTTLADELGLDNPEPRSYLRMLLEKSEES